MSIQSLLRCAAVPAGLTLLLGGAMAADAPSTTAPAVVSPTMVSPAVVSPAVTAAAPARVRPDFSGSWQLDPKASDDPAKVPGGGERGQGGPGGRGAGRGRGPGGGSGGRGSALDPNQGSMPGESLDGSDAPERDGAEGRQSAREFGQLEIFHSGDEFDLTDGMQVSRMLQIGGQPTEVFTPRGPVKATAAWDNDALLVTESDPQGQVRRTRQFQLSSDGGTLTVREIRHRPGKEGSHTMTMVYRRQADPGKP